jgi:hypothetical protein
VPPLTRRSQMMPVSSSQRLTSNVVHTGEECCSPQAPAFRIDCEGSYRPGDLGREALHQPRANS